MSKDSIAAEDFNYSDFPFFEHNNFAESPLYSSQSYENVSQESSELLSDLVLDYISQMLLEEDVDDEYDMLESHPDLEATEKPFYELIGEKYPSSPDQFSLHSSSNPESPDSNRSHNSNSSGIQSDSSEFPEYQNHLIPGGEGEILFKTFSTFEFEKGIEEAKKFLPSEDKLALNVGEIDLTLLQGSIEQVRRQKNRHFDESGYEEARRIKQSAFSYEEPVISSEMFDDVLLCGCERFPQVVSEIREKMYKEAGKHSKNSRPNDSGVGRKSRRKKQLKEEVVDFNTLLLHCAQTVTNGDNLRACELLKQIRQHSSPHGDASQRLAHYLANGLEARLAGTGSEVYHSLVSKRRTVSDVLKAYQLYLACCPFKKITYYFANQTILDTIQNATRVHILDFGIYFGFQWPCFIKMLSDRPGGPPMLRITGIDIPEPGFRPTERIEETGRRLAEFAKRFGVPFEYHAVAAKFDEVKVEDLHIEEEEMLVVNCLFRLHGPADESVTEDCPRDKVLNTIRKLKPAVFVNVVVNGTYGAPFFMSRFRETLYYFSAIFDILDSTTPRENEQRLLVERDLYGKYLINAISCEGLERERPETYKQWQVRFLRAGFDQLTISKGLVKQVKDGVRNFYHKDFNMDEDGKWLLEGWKGRILYGLSVWKPRCF
uniref:Scarecrow-like protein 14-like isoform X5 n=1 Tax=Cymbidium sinense TaxID=112615 RepID=A0A515HGK8_9ASPA|nr:scarecrow-like protein 14-like isoform X5 [Cymbidium sinense]